MPRQGQRDSLRTANVDGVRVSPCLSPVAKGSQKDRVRTEGQRFENSSVCPVQDFTRKDPIILFFF